MTRLKKYILAPGINEDNYEGNLGFEEMVKFYRMATSDEIEEMEMAVKEADWEEFKQIIYKVTNVKLQ